MFALAAALIAVTPLDATDLRSFTLTWRTGEMSKDSSSQQSTFRLEEGVLTYTTKASGRGARMPTEEPKTVTLTAEHAARLYPLIEAARKTRSASLWSRPFQGRYFEVTFEEKKKGPNKVVLEGPPPEENVLRDDRGKPGSKSAQHDYDALNALHTALAGIVMGLTP